MPRALAPPDPPLTDGVVRVRAIGGPDAAAYAAAFLTDPRLGELAGEERDPTEDEVRERIEIEQPRLRAEGRLLELAIADAATDDLLGAVALHAFAWPHARADLGIWLVPGARGAGHAERALRLVVPWAFAALDLARLQLMTFPDNAPMRRLAARLGFREEGTLRSYTLERGRGRSFVLSSLLREELEVRAPA